MGGDYWPAKPYIGLVCRNHNVAAGKQHRITSEAAAADDALEGVTTTQN